MIFKSLRLLSFLVLLCIDKVIFPGEADTLFLPTSLIIALPRPRPLTIKRLNFKMATAGISEIYRNVLGSDLSQCVRNSKVLMVGAGGIGCELLKNLVLTGFKDIEVVSASTIDVVKNDNAHV